MTSERRSETGLPSYEVLDLLAKFQAGVANVAAISLAINYPTAASVPHSIAKGLRNLRAIAAATQVTFSEAETDVTITHEKKESGRAWSQRHGHNMVQSRCCPLQSPATDLPSFGVSFLFPSSVSSVSSPSTSSTISSPPHPMLQLIGLSDEELQEQMAKGHSYAFNMGNSNIIPFKDFREATKVLMDRNMAEVLNNTQIEPVFMPETHLPNMTRVVDEKEYKAKKAQLDEEELQFLEIKAGTEDSQVALGDLAEKELFEQLKKFYKNRKVVLFWGPKLRVPSKRGGHQEFDFVIIDLDLKAIIGIESKATLSEGTATRKKYHRRWR